MDILYLLIPLSAGLVLVVIGVFGWALHRGEHALVDLRLLRHRPLAASASLMFLTGATLYGAMLLLPLSFQELRGTDALGAGLLERLHDVDLAKVESIAVIGAAASSARTDPLAVSKAWS